MELRVLAVGDVVGEGGLQCLEQHLRSLKKLYRIDFCVVNGENASGTGLTPKQADRMLDAGADILTLGNHSFDRREICAYLDDCPYILRPANLLPSLPGRGFGTFETKIGPVGIVNLLGRCSLDFRPDNPFRVIDKVLKELDGLPVLLDFHAEATSEKLAMAYYLDGKISAQWGTHTHVQTADEQILPKGTGYLTDLGMTGPVHSVIGVKPEQSIANFRGNLPHAMSLRRGRACLQARSLPSTRNPGTVQARKGWCSVIKFLHAADLHLDAPFAALSPEQAAERRREQRAFLTELAEAANTHDCDLVLLAGDLFDSAGASDETLLALQRTLSAIRAPVFISPGNHDCLLPGSAYLTEVWPENVHIFKTDEIEAVELPEKNLRVYGAGFTARFEKPLLEGFHAKSDGMTNLMVVHGNPTQAASPYNPITQAQLEASGLAYLALGHIHQASGLLRCGKTCYAWPGCAMGRGFDELGQKGVYLGEISDSGVRLDFLPLPGRKYEILRVEAGERCPLRRYGGAAGGYAERYLPCAPDRRGGAGRCACTAGGAGPALLRADRPRRDAAPPCALGGRGGGYAARSVSAGAQGAV